MFFSIVVPVFNVETYIEKCVQSVLEQTFSDWELLLIDDGSTDQSGMLCQTFVEKDSRVRYFYKENGGPSDTRNYGIERSQGKYLFFLDSDDFIANFALESLYEECIDWKMPDVLLSEGEFLYSEDGITKRRNFNCKEYKGISGRDAILKTMHIAPNWGVFGKCYRLDYWRKHGFWFSKGKLGEDLEMVDRVVLEAETISMVPTFYYYRLSRGGSLTTEVNKKQKFDDLLALISWEKYFEEKHIDEEVRTAFRSMTVRMYCYEILGSVYLFKGDEKKELLKLEAEMLFYLNYSSKQGIKLMKILCRCFGLKFSCFVLGKLKHWGIV